MIDVVSGIRWAAARGALGTGAFLAIAGLAVSCAEAPPHPPGMVATLPGLPEAPPPVAQVAPRTAAIAARYGLSPTALVSSPSGARLLFVERTPRRAGHGDDHVLVMVGPEGRELGRYPAALPGLIGDVAFLGEDRATYVVHEGGAPAHPERAPHVVQPLVIDRTPRICRGRAFTFSPDRTHLLHVAGAPGAQSLWLDGDEMYPGARPSTAKRGSGPKKSGLSVHGEPVFSPDGKSVAWLEQGRPARLVVRDELEGWPSERRWELPSGKGRLAADTQIFWQGNDRLLVGTTRTHPLFDSRVTVARATYGAP